PSAAPFVAPTPKPSDYPTSSPTISPAPTKRVPDQIGIVADQDTTVFLDGFYVGESYGNDPSFLVQHGDDAFNEIPDTVALLTFPLREVPTYDRLTNTKKNAILRLFHETTEAERGSATYTVVRLPGTPMDVEQFHGYLFSVPKDEAKGIVVGPEFTVNWDTTAVDIDITSLLFDGEEDEHDQLFIMLQDRGPEQPEGGDRFFSREHPEFKPLLLIDLKGGSAADVYVDTTTPPPTPSPGGSSGGNTGGSGNEENNGDGGDTNEGDNSEGNEGGEDSEINEGDNMDGGDNNEEIPEGGDEAGPDAQLAPSVAPRDDDPNAEGGDAELEVTPDRPEDDPESGAQMETEPPRADDPEAGAELQEPPPVREGEEDGNVRRRR
ncbi:MAG: hypothetical protein SGARI_006332, partial [Bacillariaceae sp.]